MSSERQRWPFLIRGLGGPTLHVEAEWDAALALEVPVRIICDACGEARALSTTTAVVVANGQSGVSDEDFREHHRCGGKPQDRLDRHAAESQAEGA